jgi:hypothetical protein
VTYAVPNHYSNSLDLYTPYPSVISRYRIMTDAYIGYEKVENIKRKLCWAHCRRYFIEGIPLDNKRKEIPGSKGAERLF